MELERGVLIVFEGIDGSGKTTQAQILLETLQRKGLDAVYFREPSQGKWGRLIKQKALVADSLSPREELSLFHKDRRYNVEKNLKPALQQKKVVILDRYYFSTMAYQGARGIDPEKIRRENEKFARIPDMVFILDIEASKGLKRIKDRKKKDKLFEEEEYLVEVREIFNSIKGENIFHIDGMRPVKDISREIEKLVLKFIQESMFMQV
jgi:dTMP kinase